jgi:hypothetical protein
MFCIELSVTPFVTWTSYLKHIFKINTPFSIKPIENFEHTLKFQRIVSKVPSIIKLWLVFRRIPRDRLLTEKLMVARLVKKFPAFKRAGKFIIFHKSPPLVHILKLIIQSTPFHAVYLTYILILSSYANLGLPNGLFSCSDHSFVFISRLSHAY